MELQKEYEHVFEQWMVDRNLIDEYYWNYELLPLLNESAKLDDKTMRTIVTWLADGTQIKGKPVADVYPGVKDYMLENYDPNAPTLEEMFGLNTMPMVLATRELTSISDWEGCYDFFDGIC